MKINVANSFWEANIYNEWLNYRKNVSIRYDDWFRQFYPDITAIFDDNTISIVTIELLEEDGFIFLMQNSNDRVNVI